MFLSVGFFAIFWVFGNVDYATVFSLAPYINETAITIIGLLLLVGAMAKSAQFGLHTWLPDRMEGQRKLILSIAIVIIYIVLNRSPNFNNNSVLLEARLPPLIAGLPKEFLHRITGCMLGDGNISHNNRTRDRKKGKTGPSTGNARYRIIMDRYSFSYLSRLLNNIFSEYATGLLTPYPNPNLPQHLDKTIKQYNFATKSLRIFTRLHSIWYRYNRELNTYVKVIPLCIKEMFSPLSLAHWIMQDGFYDNNGRTQTIILCTESFTKAECIMLQDVLMDMGIKSTLKIRNKNKDTYRIRISKLSIPLLPELVEYYMHPDFMYKLGK